MKSALRNTLAVALGTLLFSVVASPVHSASDAAYIKYRQALMGSNGANMGAIGTILKEKLPHTKNISSHARAIELGAKMIKSAFKKNISAGATDAKPAIWKDWKKFQKLAKDMGKKAKELAGLAEGGNTEAIMDATKKLGKSCGACHKKFRKPKEQSYKNK